MPTRSTAAAFTNWSAPNGTTTRGTAPIDRVEDGAVAAVADPHRASVHDRALRRKGHDPRARPSVAEGVGVGVAAERDQEVDLLGRPTRPRAADRNEYVVDGSLNAVPRVA